MERISKLNVSEEVKVTLSSVYDGNVADVPKLVELLYGELNYLLVCDQGNEFHRKKLCNFVYNIKDDHIEPCFSSDYITLVNIIIELLYSPGP